jgi:hypothetical protein
MIVYGMIRNGCWHAFLAGVNLAASMMSMAVFMRSGFSNAALGLFAIALLLTAVYFACLVFRFLEMNKHFCRLAQAMSDASDEILGAKIQNSESEEIPNDAK